MKLLQYFHGMIFFFEIDMAQNETSIQEPCWQKNSVTKNQISKYHFEGSGVGILLIQSGQTQTSPQRFGPVV